MYTDIHTSNEARLSDLYGEIIVDEDLYAVFFLFFFKYLLLEYQFLLFHLNLMVFFFHKKL